MIEKQKKKTEHLHQPSKAEHRHILHPSKPKFQSSVVDLGVQGPGILLGVLGEKYAAKVGSSSTSRNCLYIFTHTYMLRVQLIIIGCVFVIYIYILKYIEYVASVF